MEHCLDAKTSAWFQAGRWPMPNGSVTIPQPELPTVDEILNQRLGFLRYSTQKRNLAYLWQFLTFLKHLFDHWPRYGSVSPSMVRQIVLTTTNMIEYLLFIAIRQTGETPQGSVPPMIGQAKRLGMIDRNLARRLNTVVDNWRNRLHPNRQGTELDFHFFTEQRVSECISRVEELTSALRVHFRPNEVQTEASECYYADYHELIFSPGQVCPLCGPMVG